MAERAPRLARDRGPERGHRSRRDILALPRSDRTKGAVRDHYPANGAVPRPSVVHRGRRASGSLQAATQHRRRTTLAAYQRTSQMEYSLELGSVLRDAEAASR